MNDTKQINTAEEWVRVGHFDSLQQAYDHGLVILAMGEACRVEQTTVPGEFELQAEVVPAARIAEELDAYGRESAIPVRAVAPGREWSRYPAGWWFCGAWVLALLLVFHQQAQDPSLVERGASSSIGIFDSGEWWRPFTALFLHADIPHLAGNIVGGAIFAALVSKAIGPLKAWAMILLCGTMGNLITAWMNHPDAFRSIGASTAVFAALGILSGLGVSETMRDRARLPWARITAPVLAGVVLLSWLGGGNGSNTDVMGHVFGFGSGLVAGVAVGVVEDKRSQPG